MTPVHELGRKWAIEVKKLHELEVPKFLLPKKIKLLKYAEKIRDSLVTGEPIVNAVESSDLGFLPAVPIVWAAGGAAIAAMLSWMGYTRVVTSTASQAESLKKSGLNDKQIENLLAPKDNRGLYIAGGAIGTVLLVFMLSKRNEKN